MLRATRSLPARTRLVALGLQLHVRTMAKKGRGPTNSSSNVVTMHGLKKVLPGGRVLLENVNLKLTAGAKVGVLGANGAGKSSFLRVLAGWDAELRQVHRSAPQYYLLRPATTCDYLITCAYLLLALAGR